MNKNKITIILNCLDDIENALFCLRSWLEQDFDHNFKIVLNLFNNKINKFQKCINRYKSDNIEFVLNILEKPKYFNISASNNYGLHFSQSDYTLFSNVDILYKKDFLKNLYNELIQNNVEYGRIGRLCVEGTDRISLFNQHNNNREEYLKELDNRRETYTYQHYGAAWVGKTKIFKDIGGYCNLFLAMEDADFEFRICIYLGINKLDHDPFMFKSNIFGYHLPHEKRKNMFEFAEYLRAIIEGKRDRYKEVIDSDDYYKIGVIKEYNNFDNEPKLKENIYEDVIPLIKSFKPYSNNDNDGEIPNTRNHILNLLRFPKLNQLYTHNLLNCLSYNFNLEKSIDDTIYILILAFNNHTFVSEQIRLFKKYFHAKYKLIYFDNSSNIEESNLIYKICKEKETSYLKFPKDEYDFNGKIVDEHSYTLNSLYYNFIRKVEPKYFATIDHDFFPIADIIDVNKILEKNDGFGYIKGSSHLNGYLNIAFQFLVYNKVKDYEFDFSSKEGSEAGVKMKKLVNDLRIHAIEPHRYINLKSDDPIYNIEIIGEQWVHCINGSNWDPVIFDKNKEKIELFKEYLKEL